MRRSHYDPALFIDKSGAALVAVHVANLLFAAVTCFMMTSSSALLKPFNGRALVEVARLPGMESIQDEENRPIAFTQRKVLSKVEGIRHTGQQGCTYSCAVWRAHWPQSPCCILCGDICLCTCFQTATAALVPWSHTFTECTLFLAILTNSPHCIYVHQCGMYLNCRKLTAVRGRNHDELVVRCHYCAPRAHPPSASHPCRCAVVNALHAHRSSLAGLRRRNGVDVHTTRLLGSCDATCDAATVQCRSV